MVVPFLPSLALMMVSESRDLQGRLPIRRKL